MHTINDISGRGRYLIEVANCLISVEVLLHPAGGYVAYTDVSRSIPLCAMREVAGRLLLIERRISLLNQCLASAPGDEVTGTAV